MRAVLIAVFLTGGLARGALAQEPEAAPSPLAAARQAYESGELDRALSGYTEALATPGNGPAELAEIHFHLGVLQAALGEEEAARRAFDAALAIDPTLRAPDELSPAQRLTFDQARAARASGPMTLRAEVLARASDESLRLRVRAANVPTDLVARISIHTGEAAGELLADEPVDASGAITATVPCTGVCPVRLTALDVYGGRLREEEAAVELPAPPPVPTSVAPVAVEREPEPRRSVLRSPWLWIAIAAVVAGGVTAGLLLRPDGEDTYVLGPPRVGMR